MKHMLMIGLTLATTYSHAADWSDNSIGVRYSSKYSEVGVGKDISKTIFSFTHASGDKYGSNFFTVDHLTSNSKDPAANSQDGAQEIYGFYQRTLSLSAFTQKDLSNGLSKDVALLMRADLGTKNTSFASRPRKFRVGLDFPIELKSGFWDIGISAYKETNHNGIVGKSVSFDPTWSVTSAWGIPLGAGNLGGFASIVGPKGKDGFGVETKTEVLARVNYLFDVADTGLKVGGAYEYWKNMYGSDDSKDSTGGSHSSTPMIVAEYHF